MAAAVQQPPSQLSLPKMNSHAETASPTRKHSNSTVTGNRKSSRSSNSSKRSSSGGSSRSRSRSSNSNSQHEDVDMDRIPTPTELEKCADLPILTKTSASIPFRDLYNRPGRHLVIFIRHFFCGLCQDYLRLLASQIPPEALTSLSTPASISIVGCGSSEMIEHYSSYTDDCPYPIYADHMRQLYDALDMTSTLEMGSEKPAYQTSNFACMVRRNMWQVISSGRGAVKGGNFSQLGGELMFEDGQLIWCHRMRNTRDHTEVEDLKKFFGL